MHNWIFAVVSSRFRNHFSIGPGHDWCHQKFSYPCKWILTFNCYVKCTDKMLSLFNCVLPKWCMQMFQSFSTPDLCRDFDEGCVGQLWYFVCLILNLVLDLWWGLWCGCGVWGRCETYVCIYIYVHCFGHRYQCVMFTCTDFHVLCVFLLLVMFKECCWY